MYKEAYNAENLANLLCMDQVDHLVTGNELAMVPGLEASISSRCLLN